MEKHTEGNGRLDGVVLESSRRNIFYGEGVILYRETFWIYIQYVYNHKVQKQQKD